MNSSTTFTHQNVRTSVAAFLAALALLAAFAAPAAASSTVTTVPISTGPALTLLTGGIGTPLGDSAVTIRRAGPQVVGEIVLADVEKNTTYDFVFFLGDSVSRSDLVESITTDNDGNGTARFWINSAAADSIVVIVDDGIIGTTLTGALLSWEVAR